MQIPMKLTDEVLDNLSQTKLLTLWDEEAGIEVECHVESIDACSPLPDPYEEEEEETPEEIGIEDIVLVEIIRQTVKEAVKEALHDLLLKRNPRQQNWN